MHIIPKKLNEFIESFSFLKSKKNKKPKTIWITTAQPSEHVKKILENQLAMDSTSYSKFKMEQIKYEMNAKYSIKDTIAQLQYKSK